MAFSFAIHDGVSALGQEFWDRALAGDAEGFAYHAACEEAGRSSAATDPTVMNDCAEVRAKIDAFDDDDKNEVETPALQLRISTLEQK